MRLRVCKRIVVGVTKDVVNNNILLFAAALSYYLSWPSFRRWSRWRRW